VLGHGQADVDADVNVHTHGVAFMSVGEKPGEGPGAVVSRADRGQGRPPQAHADGSIHRSATDSYCAKLTPKNGRCLTIRNIMDKPLLQVVVASTRPGRVGLPVAEWFRDRAAAHGAFDVELV